MRILWLPHHHWSFIREGQREFHLARTLKKSHEVHFLTWQEVQNSPAKALGSLRERSWQEDGFFLHQARRVPNFVGRRLHEGAGRGLPLNERLYSRAVRDVVARERIDVVICGLSHQLVGLPPGDLPVPLVFDYLDYKFERWPEIETEYLDRADAVLCTSKVLLERVSDRHSHSYYVPNGVNLESAATADEQRVRRRYDLEGRKVVSLIGLTGSRTLFFVDGIAEAARDVPEIVFMPVGDEAEGDEFGRKMARRAAELGLRTVAPGAVPPAEVADYFAASDVGLYPGDQTAYFDAASPLKILEYTAARRPVVATDLAELRNWSFPNVRLAPPTPAGFAHEIKLALEQAHDFPDLASFSWSAIGERLQTILEDVVERARS